MNGCKSLVAWCLMQCKGCFQYPSDMDYLEILAFSNSNRSHYSVCYRYIPCLCHTCITTTFITDCYKMWLGNECTTVCNWFTWLRRLYTVGLSSPQSIQHHCMASYEHDVTFCNRNIVMICCNIGQFTFPQSSTPCILHACIQIRGSSICTDTNHHVCCGWLICNEQQVYLIGKSLQILLMNMLGALFAWMLYLDMYWIMNSGHMWLDDTSEDFELTGLMVFINLCGYWAWVSNEHYLLGQAVQRMLMSLMDALFTRVVCVLS